MKKSVLFPLAIAAVLLTGCKAEDEIINVPTPKPETQHVVITNQSLQPEHAIVVHGSGEVIVSPDFATIALKVTAAADTAENASQTCAEKMQAVLDAAQKLGIQEADRKVASIEITAVTRESDGATTGYLATETVTLTIRDIEFVNSVMSTLVDSSVSEIVSVSYSLLDASGAYRSALAAAMDDAKARATAIAEASSLRLGPVVAVEEADSFEKDIADEDFESSEIAISALVTVTYSIP